MTNDGAGARILLAEDDPTISALVAYSLQREGYEVVQEADGRRAAERAMDGDVDLVLLDRMMPNMEGLDAARRIKRERPELPLIMLTALSGGKAELAGFEAGADDYVTKPFDMDELLARVRAQLGYRPRSLSSETRGFSVYGVEFDDDRLTVSSTENEIHLRPTEYRLLRLLASAPGHLFSRQDITEQVWRHAYLARSRALDTHVASLRRHLETLDAGIAIETVRGVGYRFVAVFTSN